MLQQWQAGQRQTKQLFEEIKQQGYQGTHKTVARYTHQWRQVHRQQLSNLAGRGPAPASIESKQPPLSARRATWLVLKPSQQQAIEDDPLLIELQQHPELT